MCGGFPNSGTGTPPPPQTFWEAVCEIWQMIRASRQPRVDVKADRK